MNVDLRALGPERRGSTHSSRSCARELWTRWWADLQQPAMIGAEAKMRAASVVGAAAILIFVGEVWACAAGAEDAIKPGKHLQRQPACGHLARQVTGSKDEAAHSAL